MKKLLTLVIALTLLTSCSSDDSPETPPTLPLNNIVLLKQYSTENKNGIDNWDIEYEGTRMTKLKASDDSSHLNYVYTNNLLTDVKAFIGNDADRNFVINYNENSKISKITVFESNGRETYKFEITYLSENKFIHTTYYNSEKEASDTYTLQNGNIVTLETKNNRTEFEYDTKNSPRKNMEFSSVFQIIRYDNIGEYSTNNRTKTTIYGNDGTSAEYTYQYTYDAKNYPLTKKCFYNGEWFETITYSYK